MSDMSRSEDGQGTSRDFAGRRPPFLHHTSSAAAVIPAPLYSATARASGLPSSLPSGTAPKPAFRANSTTDTMAALIHDTRNMVMALDLYCDLLDEPGVLGSPFGHYARELRLVSGASRRLMETLASLSAAEQPATAVFAPEGQESFPLNLLNFPESPKEQEPTEVFSVAKTRSRSLQAEASLSKPPGSESRQEQAMLQSETTTASDSSIQTDRGVHWPSSSTRGWRSGRSQLDLYMDRRIEDLSAELQANHNLLSALAGPGVTVALSISGGRIPIVMAPEDLTRVLVNLVRNAVEVMPAGGEVQISLEEGPQFVALNFADTGPGIPRNELDKIFSPGYSSHAARRGGERSFGRSGMEAGKDWMAEPGAKSGTGLELKLEPEPESAAGAPLISNAHAWPVQHRGLGLSIVRAIVGAAGGSVWASNRVGQRTALQCAMPAAEFELSRIEPLGAMIHIEFPLPPVPASS